jgi:hypothetical protein
MSDAVSALGATITIDGTEIEEARDITGLELSTDEVEVTNHSSPGFGEELIPTIKRWGTLSFDMNALPTAPGQQALYDAWVARDDHTFVITYTNDVVASFTGFVSQFGLSAPVADINMVSVVIRPKSEPTITWGS